MAAGIAFELHLIAITERLPCSHLTSPIGLQNEHGRQRGRCQQHASSGGRGERRHIQRGRVLGRQRGPICSREREQVLGQGCRLDLACSGALGAAEPCNWAWSAQSGIEEGTLSSQGTDRCRALCCARSVFGFYDDLEVTDPDAGSSAAAKDHADTSDVRFAR